MYELISKAWATKFLTSQSDLLAMAVRPLNSYSSRFVIREASIQNRSGFSVVVGLGGRFPIALWKAGQWVNGTTTFIDDTTDAQSAAASDFALTTLVANDGFILLSLVPFNIASLVIGVASTGSPAYDVAYSVAGGTWAALTNSYVAPDFSAVGEQLLWFEPPVDWGITEAGHATGISTGYYGIRVRATTAPTVAPLATIGVLGRMFYSTEGVADNAIFSLSGETELWLPPQCNALMSAISVANPQNRATIEYRMVG